jgi:hypothetical protein
LLACLVAGLATACATQPARERTALPYAFTDPARFPAFSSTAAPATIEARLRRSRCGKVDTNVSGLAFAGLNTQPETGGGVILDAGRTPDGKSWFLHEAADDHDVTYCGVALVGAGTGTNVSVTGVRAADMEAIRAAVESGDFFCTCKELAR